LNHAGSRQMSVFQGAVGVRFYLCAFLCLLSSCSTSTAPVPGPDKQGIGLLTGGLIGAGSGMITGAQLSAPTGPGMAIGAAFGAVWGSLHGLGLDLIEEEELRLLAEVDRLHEKIWVQNALISHYEKKKDLHPDRDIFPADEFFTGDGVEVSRGGSLLAHAIAKRYMLASPSSRVLITSYHATHGKNSEYTSYLGKRRAQAIARELVAGGLEPRRFILKSVHIGAALVDDPYDDPARYTQAVEFSLVDSD
jgi:hypothetical protein